MPKPHIPQRDLEDAMAEGGCPVCRLAERAVRRYLISLLRERVTDVDERARLRAARGLCNLHAWQLQEGGGALGIALIYRDLVHTLEGALAEGGDAGAGAGRGLLARLRGAGAGPAGRLRATAPCPACSERDETERLAVGGLLEYLRRADFRAHYRAADGLCLHHFLQALDGVSDAQTLQQLLEVQLRVEAGLRAELDEFIRKHDYRFSGEPIGAEADAWIRAIAHVAGERRAASLRS